MITIIFETHSTTFDNEDGLATGWFDVELSKRGRRQAKELGQRYENENFDAIFCSDFRSAYMTADLAFKGKNFTIIRDKRLRECDYGEFSGKPKEKVEAEKINKIFNPFPNGESYEQASIRVREFLDELLKKYDGKKIMIIGHRSTQYALERWVNGESLRKIAMNEWKWQPGWTYKFEKIRE